MRKKKKRNNCTIRIHVYTSNGYSKKKCTRSSPLFFHSPVRLSHIGARTCINEEKDHSRARHYRVYVDNQVMKAREERTRKKAEKNALLTMKQMYHRSYPTFSFVFVLVLLPITADYRYRRWLEDDETVKRQIYKHRSILPFNMGIVLAMVIFTNQSRRSRSVAISMLESDVMFA